jgi:hypothetical protein
MVVRLVLPERLSYTFQQPIGFSRRIPLDRLSDSPQRDVARGRHLIPWLWGRLLSLPVRPSRVVCVLFQWGQQNLDVVGHDGEGQERVQIAVVMKKGIHDQLGNPFIPQPLRFSGIGGKHPINEGKKALAVTQGAIPR